MEWNATEGSARDKESRVRLKIQEFNEEEKFAQATQKLSKTIHQIYGGKKLPSVEKQFADLR